MKKAQIESIAQRLISDTDSDVTDVTAVDSQSLFQHTAIRSMKPTVDNDTTTTTTKSLLRTPTKKFAMRIIKGQKWPVNTMNVSTSLPNDEEKETKKKNVSFGENEVREFSSQESTDVEIISASDEGLESDTTTTTTPSQTFTRMLQSRQEGSSQEEKRKRTNKTPPTSSQSPSKRAYTAVIANRTT